MKWILLLALCVIAPQFMFSLFMVCILARIVVNVIDLIVALIVMSFLFIRR